MPNASATRLFVEGNLVKCEEKDGRRKCGTTIMEDGKVTDNRGHKFSIAQLLDAATRAGQVTLYQVLREFYSMQLSTPTMAEQAIRMPLLERPPFATIEVGTFKAVADLRQALVFGRFLINDLGNDLLWQPKFTLLTETAKLDLYRASNAELGYPNGCTVAQSFEALEKIGAVKLPPEAGAQFRLQYPGQQPLGEWCLTYMDPITDSNDNFMIFHVGHDDHGLWLRGDFACPDRFYGGGGVWVFARK